MNAAHHDLLFGLLALQNGLIDQGQLVAAFQAWTRDKVRPLAEHLDRPRRPRRRAACRDRGAGRAAPEEARRRRRSRAWPRSLPAAPPARAWRGLATRRSRRRLAMSVRHTARPRTAMRRPHGFVRRRLGHQRRPAVPRPPAPCPGRPGCRFRRPRQRTAPRGGAQADPRLPRRRPDQPPAVPRSRPRSPAAWSTRASCRSTAWVRTATAAPFTPCGSSRATASRRPSSGSTPTTS